MPNANYLRGVRKERKIVNSNRQNGLIAFRSAGSHSPIDVCAINLELKSIRFYQCKPDDFGDNQAKKILETYVQNGKHKLKELNDFFKVSFQVV